MTKCFVRYFTIADFEREEQWLHEMALQGYQPVRLTAPCFYTFELCEPADLVFKLEFSDVPLSAQPGYREMLEDYGWRCLFTAMGWRYYCKAADERPIRNELFTDDESKLAMIETVLRRRLAPLVIILVCCLLPNYLRTIFGEPSDPGWTTLFSSLMLLYGILMTYVGVKFIRFKRGSTLNIGVREKREA